MSTARITEYLSEDDYLAGELHSDVRHEYVDGSAYAMAGAKVAHNTVSTNITGTLHSQLKGNPCRAFGSDIKVRIKGKDHTRFYYPDGMIVCDSNDADSLFQDKPVVLIEVLSDSTRRIDTGEKFEAYRSIESLTHYVLIEPDTASVVVYERGDDEWLRTRFANLSDSIVFKDLGVELPMTDIYDRVLSDE
jgi:Uma2 family endonuclease